MIWPALLNTVFFPGNFSWLVHYWSGPVPNDHFREVEWQICLSSCTMWFIKDPRKCPIGTGSWLNRPKVNKLSFQNLCWPRTVKDWLTTTTAAEKNIWTRPWEFCQLLSVSDSFVTLFLCCQFVFVCSEKHPLLVTSIHWLTRGVKKKEEEGQKSKIFWKQALHRCIILTNCSQSDLVLQQK